jgi:SAM-dependent methyltransferase
MNLLRQCLRRLGTVLPGRASVASLKSDHARSVYIEGGRIPWSEGYSRHRNAVIEGALADPSSLECFASGRDLPPGYGFKLDERCIEIPWIFLRYPRSAGKRMDAGCAYLKFDAIRRRLDPDSSVTLLTLDKRDMAFPVVAREVVRLEADMRSVSLGGGTFDAITCVSTLEHVGMDNTQLYTADAAFREQSEGDFLRAFRELVRLLKSGGSLFVTVPHGARKNHGWLQVFDAAMLDRMIDSPDVTLVEESIYRHGPSGWARATRESAAQSIYFDVHAAGADATSSSLAAAEAVACLWFKRQ